MPKHITRLLSILVVGALLAYAGKSYLTDPSFYRFGHYRADAVTEIAALKPVIETAPQCQTCHEQRLNDWAVGSHKTVQCEICHGFGNEGHPDNGLTRVPADTIKLCTLCHEAMPSRPARQPQIVVGEHPFPGEGSTQCIECHDPHIPGGGPDTTQAATGVQAAGTVASVPAKVSKCAKCHGKLGEGRKKNPALAGTQASILIERINLYKTGERSNKMMNKYAKSLSDDEIAELAEYYAALPAPPAGK